MKKSLNDLIENSYNVNPDVDEDSEAVGIVITSFNESKRHYVSRFIQKNENQDNIERKRILRVMLRELIIQYGTIIDIDNIDQIIEKSYDIRFDVENFICMVLKSNSCKAAEDSTTTDVNN